MITVTDSRGVSVTTHSASTRVEKTEEKWRETLDRMQGYGAMLTWQNEEDFAKTLSANSNGGAYLRDARRPSGVGDAGMVFWRANQLCSRH
jgi:hypothetical protein